jgi:hypothetical protein
MSNFRQFDRATGFLLPPSLDEWLPERHLARKPFGKAALGGHTGAAFLRDGGEAMVRCDDDIGAFGETKFGQCCTDAAKSVVGIADRGQEVGPLIPGASVRKLSP